MRTEEVTTKMMLSLSESTEQLLASGRIGLSEDMYKRHGRSGFFNYLKTLRGLRRLICQMCYNHVYIETPTEVDLAKQHVDWEITRIRTILYNDKKRKKITDEENYDKLLNSYKGVL